MNEPKDNATVPSVDDVVMRLAKRIQWIEHGGRHTWETCMDSARTRATEQARACILELSSEFTMLAFLLNQFQMCSPKMDGQHSWRFRQGWPWTHAKGRTIEIAVQNAIKAIERERVNTKEVSRSYSAPEEDKPLLPPWESA